MVFCFIPFILHLFGSKFSSIGLQIIPFLAVQKDNSLKKGVLAGNFAVVS